MIIFTNREKEVLTYLALSMDYQSTSRLMNIQEKTVYNTKLTSLTKIGIRKNAKLVKWLRIADARRAIAGDPLK